jgi:hypothetical protein
MIALLLALLVAYAAQSLGGNGSVPGFDPASIAYNQFGDLESYRKQNPARRNYCEFTVVVVDAAGNVVTGAPVAKIDYGFGVDENYNHCEQKLLQWLYETALQNVYQQYKLEKGYTLNAVLSTQVRACLLCKPSFQSWESLLKIRVSSRTKNVQFHLFVYEIRYRSASGFAPRDYPAGPYYSGSPVPNTTPPVSVQQSDIKRVYP